MARASKRTDHPLEAALDRHAEELRDSVTGVSPMHSTCHIVTTGPEYTRDPDGSTHQDENRGLAARLLELRRTVEGHERQRISDLAETRRLVAQIGQRADTMQKQLDEALKSIDQKQRDLEVALREGGEQVRAAGELGRKMQDHVRVLDELREMAADPHEVVKPLRRDIGELKHALTLLDKQVDHRFEETAKQLTRLTARERAYETRN